MKTRKRRKENNEETKRKKTVNEEEKERREWSRERHKTNIDLTDWNNGEEEDEGKILWAWRRGMTHSSLLLLLLSVLPLHLPPSPSSQANFLSCLCNERWLNVSLPAPIIRKFGRGMNSSAPKWRSSGGMESVRARNALVSGDPRKLIIVCQWRHDRKGREVSWLNFELPR